MSKLHETQERLLNLLRENQDHPLTVRELQAELGLSTHSLVIHHLQQLEKKGRIRRNPYNPQDYQIIDEEKPVILLNLYGLAQCGPEGSILDGNPIDRIPVATKLLNFPAQEAFLVKARGDSMEPLIKEGDLVIARKTNLVNEGKMVVCVNDGMALIKRYHLSDGGIVLESENSKKYPARIAKDDFRIEGEVRGIISSIH